MNAWEQSLQSLGYILHAADVHYIAAVLKLCAAEIDTRKLAGGALLYDVAYDLNHDEHRARLAALVTRYLTPPPRP